ncbi:MAG: BMP family ABC transporter substrate-binding protein [Clostridiaceae bacterium]|jgi:basic membrane protein A|nr:BMP family ABC transporter substrate-binding protein [Clostridiaceae bacterium]
MKKHTTKKILTILGSLIIIFSLAHCAPKENTSEQTAPQPQKPEEVGGYKLAAILPGPIEDADFNALGYNAVQHIKEKMGIEADYSEKVPVADAERVGREYIGSGYNIIVYHGGQFVAAAQTLAKEYPDITFVVYTAGQDQNVEIGNIWNVGLRYFPAAYPLGVLAAKMTNTNKVAFVAGIKTPIFIAAFNAFNDGVKATDPSIDVIYNFTGDQNDSVKARQTAEAMIGDGADVISVYLNQGVFGVHEAVLASDSKILMTAINTDKSESAPDNYLSSIVADFTVVWEHIVKEVMAGNKGGYYGMNIGSGLELAPFTNTPDDVKTEIEAVAKKISTGELVVEEDNKNLP